MIASIIMNTLGITELSSVFSPTRSQCEGDRRVRDLPELAEVGDQGLGRGVRAQPRGPPARRRQTAGL